MERIKIYIIMAFVQLFCLNMNGQNWTLTDSEGQTINASLTDSITFENVAGKFVQHVWRDGAVISSSDVEYGTKFEPQSSPLEYQEFTFEEDGVDAVITKDGLFAMLKQIPESSDYIFINGILDEDAKEYMLIDENGFIKAIDLGDNNIVQILYTPQSLLLLDSTGSVLGEIPYTELPNDETVLTRATYTRSRIFRALQLRNTIKDWVKEPIKTGARDLFRRLSEGYANRYGALLNDLIDLAFDYGDILTWLEMLDRLEEISYFGNAKLTALDAVKEKVCTFKTPCKVEGLDSNPDFKNVLDIYETLLNYKYTLFMEARQDQFFSSESYLKEKEISGNGVEDFEFTFQELEELYSYEPHLTVDLDIQIFVDEISYNRAALSVPNAPAWKPNPYTIHKSCTIYGDGNSLVTGSVSSKVEKVQNPNNSSADIICTFSDVPEGAECNVKVQIGESDIYILFTGSPDKQSQTVKASGLAPNTSYVASTSISYKGRSYAGTNSVSFRTSGPSGSVTGVSDVTDKSAVVKCIFSNTDGAQCGIYVKSEDGKTLTFTASGNEGEQNISVSSLEPCTKYYCSAFVKTSNYYHEDDHSIGFTTEPFDISGSWTCKETYYNGYDYTHPQYKSYTVELGKDGKVVWDGKSDYVSSGWGYSCSGKLSISIMTMATNTFNSGFKVNLTADDPKNPTKFTGAINNWSFNDVVGYVGRGGNAVELTR